MDKNDNHISVAVAKDGQYLRAVVTDNGRGIAPDRLVQLKEGLLQPDEQSESFGLRSIHERLKLLYGSEYGIELQSEAGTGTTVTVYFPDLGEDDPNHV